MEEESTKPVPETITETVPETQSEITTAAKTGDQSRIAYYLGLLAASFGVLLFIARRKKEYKEYKE